MVGRDRPRVGTCGPSPHLFSIGVLRCGTNPGASAPRAVGVVLERSSRRLGSPDLMQIPCGKHTPMSLVGHWAIEASGALAYKGNMLRGREAVRLCDGLELGVLAVRWAHLGCQWVACWNGSENSAKDVVLSAFCPSWCVWNNPACPKKKPLLS